jgi:hypothetical protein
MIGDPWIIGLLHPSRIDEIVVQAFFAMAVLIAGAIVNRHLKRPARE